MRTQRVLTNLACNQNCTYCSSRAPRDAREFVAQSAVRDRIATALAKGASELVITGGEPTLRRDLPDLVEFARARGAEAIVLETNATAIDDALAQRLRAAGVTTARVNLSAWGVALDTVTRDPGGFAAACTGIRALVGAGLAVEIAVTVVRSTAAHLDRVPVELVAMLGPEAIHSVRVAVPTQSPDANEVLPYAQSVAAVLRLEAAARGVGVPVKLSPESAPPPCVFPLRARPAHIFSATPGASKRPAHTKFEACASCQINDRCSGISDEYIAQHGAPEMQPITEDRMRRRLSLIATVPEQIARELVTPNRYRDPVHGDVIEDIIRVNFHCNQVCRFCFVSTHLPPAGDLAIREAIESAARKGAKITLSGGEPTLNPRIVEYVRYARSLSKLPVLLQTNAVRLDDAGLTHALAEAGLDEAFVSLHGSTAEISDAVTGAPGTFERSLIGIDNLAATRVKIVLNFVICETNMHDIGRYVRLVGARWPKAFVNISFVAPSTDVVPRDAEFIPRYSSVMPQLAEAILDARRLGLEIGGFESMCGIPLCLVPSSLDRYVELSEIPAGFDRGEFTKAAACSGCALENRCYGIRNGYAAMHGTDELRPVAVGASGARAS